MSTLKCAKCGKTFGKNEQVIGITAEGEPEPGSPFCAKCAEEVLGQAAPPTEKKKAMSWWRRLFGAKEPRTDPEPAGADGGVSLADVTKP